MTAREWIEHNFQTVGGQFEASSAGDFSRIPLPNVNPNLMPVAPVQVSIDQFLEWFGSAIDSALASGGSIYTALTDGTVEDRGWRPYFELWKAKGIID